MHSDRPGNRILTRPSANDYRGLRPQLEHVVLKRGTVLCGMNERLNHAYFPTSCVISLVGTTSDGHGIEIGTIGSEGFLGLSIIFNKPQLLYQAVVQQTGEAWRLAAQRIHTTLQERPALRDELLNYSYIRFVQFAQSAICHQFHPLEQRLCRWLLSVHDRLRSQRLLLTHEFLAHMIGGRRPTIGTIINRLQKAGVVGYRRGCLTILDRKRMERLTCECYRIINQEILELSAE